jgi:hypothetical protein
VEGLFWRVGDESKIRIWSDKWVPKASGGYIQSPVQILDRNAVVSEIMDRDSNWWNMPLIHEVFSAEEAGLICGVAVSPRSGEDRLIWNYTKNGDFTVRSAYHLAKDKFEVDKGSCSTEIAANHYGELYGRLTGLKQLSHFCGKHAVTYCQQKINSLRKTSHEILSLSNLQHRG